MPNNNPVKHKGKTVNQQITIVGFLFMLPAFAVIAVTIIIPLVWNIILSFCSWNGGKDPYVFVGINNYVNTFMSQASKTAILHSLFIGVVSTFVSTILGLFFALSLYYIGGRFDRVCRVIFYSPGMLPMTVLGLLFTFIFSSSDKGLLNAVLRAMGLVSLEHAWLAEPGTVLWVIAILQGWKSSGTVMMLSYTAILGIPSSLYETAEMEGCSYFKEIKYLILPLIKPTVRLVLSMTLLWSFKSYDIVWTMTRGGPSDLSMVAPIYMIKTGFSYNQYGYASAIGIVTTIFTGLFIVAVRRAMKGEIYEY